MITTAPAASLVSHPEPTSDGAVRRWLRAPVGSLDIATGDALLALVALVLGVLAVTSKGVKPAGGAGAAVGMILIAAPVLMRRAAPVAGLAVLLVGDLANVAVFGEHTRCGTVLPIAAYLTFSACRRASGRADLVAPVLLATALAATTCGFELGGGGIAVCALLIGGVIVVARIVHRRDQVAADLDRQSRALQAQRDQTARLAVEAERARIVGDLGAGVDGHVATLLAHAEVGRVATDPAATIDAFSAIEMEGRAGLDHMRTVIDDLSPAGTAPQPSLDELDALLRAHRERATLRVEGERRALAPGIELAACRIVELLLGVVDPADTGLLVRARYDDDGVEVVLSCERGVAGDPGVLAAARERAAAVGGSVDVTTHGSKTRARVLLPAGAGA